MGRDIPVEPALGERGSRWEQDQRPSLRGAGLKPHGGGAALVGGQAGEENPALAQAFQKFAPFPLKLSTPPKTVPPRMAFPL